MSHYTRWAEPFCDLLDTLQATWGGSLSNSTGAVRAQLQESGAAFFIYPVYSGERSEVPFTITISRFALSRRDYMESGGRFEYLRIHIARPMACNMALRARNLIDFSRITGEDEFASLITGLGIKGDVVLESRTQRDHYVLEDDRCRGFIRQVEPFVLLGFYPTGLHWSQELEHASQLAAERIVAYVETLVETAEMVGGQVRSVAGR